MSSSKDNKVLSSHDICGLSKKKSTTNPTVFSVLLLFFGLYKTLVHQIEISSKDVQKVNCYENGFIILKIPYYKKSPTRILT